MRIHLTRALLCAAGLCLTQASFAQSTPPTIPGSQQGSGGLKGNQGSTQPPVSGANRNPTVERELPGNIPGQVQPPAGAPVVPMAVFGTIAPSPYFQEQTLRTQLGLTPEQYARLTAAYNAAYNNFNRALTQLDGLSEQQRQDRLQALANVFFNEFAQATNTVVDPDLQGRLRQIWYQYRGFLAFSDPTVRERLALTSTQLEQIRRMEANYTRQMNDIYRGATGNRDEAARSFARIRRQMMDDISSVLTDAQRRTWQEITGTVYNFQPFAVDTNMSARP